MGTAKVDRADRPRAHIRPFALFFSLWVGGTLILMLLLLIADPSSFPSNWTVGFVVGGGIWGFWCLVGYLVEGRGVRFWRLIY